MEIHNEEQTGMDLLLAVVSYAPPPSLPIPILEEGMGYLATEDKVMDQLRMPLELDVWYGSSLNHGIFLIGDHPYYEHWRCDCVRYDDGDNWPPTMLLPWFLRLHPEKIIRTKVDPDNKYGHWIESMKRKRTWNCFRYIIDPDRPDHLLVQIALNYPRTIFTTVDIEDFKKYRLYEIHLYGQLNHVCFPVDYIAAENPDHFTSTREDKTCFPFYQQWTEYTIDTTTKQTYPRLNLNRMVLHLERFIRIWPQKFLWPYEEMDIPKFKAENFIWVPLHFVLSDTTHKTRLTTEFQFIDQDPLNNTRSNLRVKRRNSPHKDNGWRFRRESSGGYSYTYKRLYGKERSKNEISFPKTRINSHLHRWALLKTIQECSKNPSTDNLSEYIILPCSP